MIAIYVFSFDQGAISTVLRSPALQKLGLWSYSIYMIHTFIFQIMKMGASFVGQKAKLDLVGWHHDEKLVLLGTPDQALLPALVLCVVLIVPVAALTYRWIEKPAMEMARGGLWVTSGRITRPAPWLRAIVVAADRPHSACEIAGPFRLAAGSRPILMPLFPESMTQARFHPHELIFRDPPVRPKLEPT